MRVGKKRKQLTLSKQYISSTVCMYLIGDDKFPCHLKVVEDWLQCSAYVICN